MLCRVLAGLSSRRARLSWSSSSPVPAPKFRTAPFFGLSSSSHMETLCIHEKGHGECIRKILDHHMLLEARRTRSTASDAPLCMYPTVRPHRVNFRELRVSEHERELSAEIQGREGRLERDVGWGLGRRFAHSLENNPFFASTLSFIALPPSKHHKTLQHLFLPFTPHFQVIKQLLWLKPLTALTPSSA